MGGSAEAGYRQCDIGPPQHLIVSRKKIFIKRKGGGGWCRELSKTVAPLNTLTFFDGGSGVDVSCMYTTVAPLA
jgi:hypothetical protein